MYEGPIYPTGMLVNTATGRFHPIAFRPAPSGVHDNRWRSLGHHTEGFATREEALADTKERPYCKELGLEWAWDGTDVPALTIFLDPKE